MPDRTSGGSDQVSGYIRRFASYILDHVCMVYVRPYCSISDPNYSIYAIIITKKARLPQLHRNEAFCKLKKNIYLHAYHQRFDMKIVIFTAKSRSILHTRRCVQVLILSSLPSCCFEGSSPGMMPRLVSYTM